MKGNLEQAIYKCIKMGWDSLRWEEETGRERERGRDVVVC